MFNAKSCNLTSWPVRRGAVYEVFSQRDFMVGNVNIPGVLQYLESHELIHKTALVNSQFNEWSRSNILWEPICTRHWHHKPLKAKFFALVSRKQSFPIWTQSTRAGSWCGAYIRAEAMNGNTFPIFAMQTRLRKGVGSGLNLFEPRYKWLAHRATAAKGRQHFTFMYCTSVPQRGGIGWLTEMKQLRWSTRGSAQFIAVPIKKCRLVEVWHESVPVNPYAPKLACCLAEPLDDDDSADTADLDTEHERFSATMSLLNLLRHRLAQGDRSPQTMEICRQLGFVVYKNTNSDNENGNATADS